MGKAKAKTPPKGANTGPAKGKLGFKPRKGNKVTSSGHIFGKPEVIRKVRSA